MNNEKRNNETKYIFLIVLAICCLATGGIYVKMSKLPPINTGFYRVLFSIPILMPFTIRKVKYLSKKEIAQIFIAGMFLAGDLILWNISFGLTTVANANLLANFTPFTIIPVSYFIFKEKIPKNFLIGMTITFSGVMVLMLGKINPSFSDFKGDLLAFCTSIFYSLFLLMVYKLRNRVDSMVIMFVSGFGSIFLLAIVIFFGESFVFPKNIAELMPLLGLALISQIMGQGLLAYCLGKVNASLSSIICLCQPVIAAVYAFIIFSEKLTIVEIVGVIITIFGVYFAKKNYKK